jgi:hypothetical protein
LYSFMYLYNYELEYNIKIEPMIILYSFMYLYN